MSPIFAYESDAPDTQIRSLGYTVDRMMAEEGVFERRSGQRSPLKILYDNWVTAGEVEPQENSQIWIQNIDVSADSPLGFVWHRHTGLTFGDLSGQTVGSLRNRHLREACAIEYTAAKLTRVPVYHLIEQTVDGMHREYARLIIPGTDNMLYYVYRLIVPPTPVLTAVPLGSA
jgi:hypothetical protein